MKKRNDHEFHRTKRNGWAGRRSRSISSPSAVATANESPIAVMSAGLVFTPFTSAVSIRSERRLGMTLLEILVVLGLMSMILGLIWGMMTLFSKNYLSSERRIGRAQLVRSISQMLNDDLGAAVQDPIHPLLNIGDDETVFIRRFGLRGDAKSLQIDVVEPNLLVEVAGTEENRAAAVTSSKPNRPQVPELKTVFYEFVPPNALIDSQMDSSRPMSETGGSQTIGSLQTPTGFDGNSDPSAFENGGAEPGNSGIGPWTGFDRSRLVRKFGLSRRELSYEDPDPTTPAETGSAAKKTSPLAGSNVIGSLATESEPFFQDAESENQRLLLGMESRPPEAEPFLSAAQIAMEIDDGTVWMPEVVDCRFRYFDGSRWFASWDSIVRGGLPTAIEVSLKLIPLDDMEEIRSSVYLPRMIFSGRLAPIGNGSFGSKPIGSLASPGGRSGPRQNRGLTVENVVDLLGLSPVMARKIVTYIPTTPLSRHHALGRRKPLPAAPGHVDSRRTDGAGSRFTSSGNVEGGRSFQSRESAVRSLGQDRSDNERVGAGDRQTLAPSLFGTGREDRTALERLAVERSQSAREDDSFTGVSGAELAPDSVDPNGAFGGIDGLLSGFDPSASESSAAGMIPTVGGMEVPTQTSPPSGPPNPKKTGTQQTWIRGKR